MNIRLAFSRLDPRQHPWRLFSSAVAVALTVHFATLSISPTIWQDEVQIIDFGRTSAFGGDPSWSVNWRSSNRPAIAISYLGPLLEESMFRFTAFSPVGPRACHEPNHPGGRGARMQQREDLCQGKRRSRRYGGL